MKWPVVPPRWAWALTGSGHFLNEALELMRGVQYLHLFGSPTVAEVVPMYKNRLESVARRSAALTTRV